MNQLSRDLFRSAESGDLFRLQEALERGANPNSLMQPEGICTMHVLAAGDQENASEMLKLLLDRGGNPNVISAGGQTPVHLSAAWGNSGALKLLLKHGGDPSVCDEDGCDALRMATVNQQRKIISLLSSHGVSSSLVGVASDNVDSSEWDATFLSCSMRTAPAPATSTEASFRSATSGRTTASDDVTTTNCSWYTVDEFLCIDDRANLAFIEQQPSEPSTSGSGGSATSSDSEQPSVVTEIFRCSGDEDSDATIVSTASSVPSVIARMRDSVLYRELRRLGQSPGPVTPSTRRVYVQRLKRSLREPTTPAAKSATSAKAKSYSGPLRQALRGGDAAICAMNLEADIVHEFGSSDKRSKWRGGVAKCCFNYLLMDPRILCNLPRRSAEMTSTQCLTTFVDAIFYVGKGKQSRPYDHFYEALRSKNGTLRNRNSKKIEKICDIWDAGFGVVSFHCFQGAIAAEAFTREACMIDAIGLANLTNEKCGEYYGLLSKCSRNEKYQLGTFFLKRALQIFLLEGERQIHPINTGFSLT